MGFAFFGEAIAQQDRALISADTVRAIERQVVMPRGAAPISSYRRFYARTRIGGRDAIMGVFLIKSAYGQHDAAAATPVPGVADAFVTEADEVPQIADGGCAEVTIYFDLALQRLLPVRPQEGDASEEQLGICNGLA